MRTKSKGWIALIIAMLILFVGTFATALYTRFNGYADTVVFVLVCLSAAFVLSAFLPIFIMILRYVYKDCKRRGIKPTFYVLISFSVVGLAYYILRRDYLAEVAGALACKNYGGFEKSRPLFFAATAGRKWKNNHLPEADINPVYIRDFLGHTDLKVT